MSKFATGHNRGVRVLALGVVVVVGGLMSGCVAVQSGTDSAINASSLAPRESFTVAPDGSSGLTEGGDGIPNVDVVKKTVAKYYGDPGTGIADKVSSPYITEMHKILDDAKDRLGPAFQDASARGEKPAIVFDIDDTALWTYDLQVGEMKYAFDGKKFNLYIDEQKFPAIPGMVDFVTAAADAGFAVFGITGRQRDRQDATLGNLTKVGYTQFAADRFFTRWTGKGDSVQPPYVSCATEKCTTSEYKSETRKHIEEDLGYTVVFNVGDQWSDLTAGYARETVKLPNPVYYAP